ncbi:glycosyltransferase family 2 protein [Microbacterium xylanilyticum]
MPAEPAPAPSASVVIPAYNAAGTLAEQLEALRGQDADQGFEVLVCDNGSTDRTADVVREWLPTMPGLRLIDASARRGASAARNIGAAAAASDVLLFCDADDVVDASWVARMAPAVVEHGFTAGLMEHAVLNPRAPWDGGWVEPTYREGFLPWLPAVGSGNMGVRRDVFDSVGGFDETRPSGEDADLSWRLQLAGQPVFSVWDAVVHVRKRTGVRTTVRQGFAKGTAVRQLQHDYALVADALSAAAAAAAGAAPAAEAAPTVAEPSGSPARPDRLGRLRRAPRRALRILRNPGELLRETGELASWAGYRFGRIDGTRSQIVPGDVSGLI